MLKTVFCLLIILCAYTESFAMPLSPESVSALKASGNLEQVTNRMEQSRARGVNQPGENILSLMRQLHRDDPDDITLRVPVILVDFRDNEANEDEYDADHFEELLFSLEDLDPGSMREWYRENSYDEVDIIGEVVGWIRLEQTYAYYVDGQNGTGNYPRNSQGMVREAVIAADDQIDYSEYDNDNDGCVDALFVVHAGPGAEANNGDEDMIWSHAWALNFNRIRLDGVWINRYSTEPEDGQVGVFGHELGHAMFGLPDLYDRDYSSEGIGDWSMMAGGSWGDEGRSPAHFDAWCKVQAEFIEPEVLDGNFADVVIPPVEEEGITFIFWQEGDHDDEYFLVENRQQIGFDASLPGSGLLIYHVDEDADDQNDNEWFPGHQNEGHYLVALEQADGNWDMEQGENRGDAGDPYPGESDNDTFNLESTPNSRSYVNQSTDVSIWNVVLDDLNIICNMEVFPGTPELVVDPGEIEEELAIGEVSQRCVNIHNAGEAVMQYHLEVAGDEPEWLDCQSVEGFLSPDATIEIPVILNAENLETGDYQADLCVRSNDPEQEVIIVPVQLTVIEGEPGLQHFTDFDQTDNNHSILITEICFEGEVVPQGWEVGVFTPQGILAGGSIWDGEGPIGLAAWGDDANTQDVVEGFQANERIRFAVWDFEADMEYESIPSIIEGSLEWAPNGFTVISLEANPGEVLTVSMSEGWNMISLNVSPGQQFYLDDEERGPDIILMMEQLRIDEDNHQVFLVKDVNGQFYNPLFNYNGIPYWNLTQGYQVKVTADVEAQWAGNRIAADADIPLEPGWNMVAYYPDYELDAGSPDYYVLSPIIDLVELAKDNDGHFMAPAFQFSDMLPWRETQGYQVKINSEEPIILNYPAPQEEIARQNPSSESANRTTHWTAPKPTGSNMSVLVDLTDYPAPGCGHQVAAFSIDGRLVGVGWASEDSRFGFPVWGDDPTTEQIDGLNEGESFLLKLWNPESNGEHNLEVCEIEYGSSTTYTNDGFLALKTTTAVNVPGDYYLSEAYPNPFNALTRLTYGISESGQTTLQIYDVSGRCVTTLYEGFQSAGHHSTTWSGDSVSSGLYLVVMKSEEFQTIRKVTLIR